jgi:hypothetical protein
MPKIHAEEQRCIVSVHVSDVEEGDMQAIYNNLPDEEQNGQPMWDYTLTNFDWMLQIFNDDWDAYRIYAGHSFSFSLDFMQAVRPLLKRADIDEIYFTQRHFDD